MSNTPKNIRYQLITPISLLSNRIIEAIGAHSNGVPYVYDNYPAYQISAALADNDTIMISQVSETGAVGLPEEGA